MTNRERMNAAIEAAQDVAQLKIASLRAREAPRQVEPMQPRGPARSLDTFAGLRDWLDGKTD